MFKIPPNDSEVDRVVAWPTELEFPTLDLVEIHRFGATSNGAGGRPVHCIDPLSGRSPGLLIMVEAAAFSEHPNPEDLENLENLQNLETLEQEKFAALEDLPEPEELPDRSVANGDDLPDDLVSALAMPLRGAKLPPIPTTTQQPAEKTSAETTATEHDPAQLLTTLATSSKASDEVPMAELPPLSPEAAKLARELLTGADRPVADLTGERGPQVRLWIPGWVELTESTESAESAETESATGQESPPASPAESQPELQGAAPEAVEAIKAAEINPSAQKPFEVKPSEIKTSNNQESADRTQPVRLVLPPDFVAEQPDRGLAWTDLWQQLMHRLYGGERGWTPDDPVTLQAIDRALEARQLKAIAEALQEVQLRLTRLETNHPATAALAIEMGYALQFTPPAPTQEPIAANPNLDLAPDCLYLDKTLRSGVEIRYPGTVVIRGDANPGSAIAAGGDILVWGRLCGVAHAGINGNESAIIMALNLATNQVRIASRTARVPESKLDVPCPEVAYISEKGIRISPAADFAKNEVRSRLGEPPA